jgi:hypothetical protein
MTFGLVVAAIAAGYHWKANHLPYSGLTDAVGAGGLPKILGTLLFGFGLLLALRAGLVILAARRASMATSSVENAEPFFELRGVALLGLAAVYVLIAPLIGYLPAILLLLVAVAVLAGAKLNLRSVLTGGLMALTLAFIFIWLVGTQQPEGPFGPLLRSWGV